MKHGPARVGQTVAGGQVPHVSTFASPAHQPRARSPAAQLQSTVGNQAVLRFQRVALSPSSSGAPLPVPLRGKLEAGMGADLGGVRVHTGPESAQAANAIGARAYTIGQDIHVGAGEYAPGTGSGEALLAHEVVHALQHADGHGPGPRATLALGTPGDALEREADTIASQLVRGEPSRPPRSRVANRVSAWASGPAPAVAGRVIVQYAIQTGNDAERRRIATELLRARDAMIATDVVAVRIGTRLETIAPDDLEPLIAEARAAIAPTATPRAGGGSIVEMDLELPSEARLRELRALGVNAPSVSDRAADPRMHSAYVDQRITAVGYGIYLGGFVLYLEGLEIPVFVPESYFDFAPVSFAPASLSIHESYAEALAVSSPGRHAYYRGALGVIAPTVFSYASAPRVVETALQARRDLASAVQEQLSAIAIGIAAGLGLNVLISGIKHVVGRLLSRRAGGSGGSGGAGSSPPPPPPPSPPAQGGGVRAPPEETVVTPPPTTARPQPTRPQRGGGNQASSSRARSEREGAAAPRRLTADQERWVRALSDEHPGLNPRVAADSVEGARSVGGAGVAGADVRLLGGGGREVSVHVGEFTPRGVANHLQGEAAQAGTTEIYLQINTPGATKEAMIRMAHGIRNGFPELDGLLIRFYGPNGDVWWSNFFRGP